MTEPDVLSSNLLVQSSCKDNPTLKQTRQDISRDQTLRQVHSSHTMSLAFRARSELLESKISSSSLNLIRDLGVNSEAAGDIGGDLGEGGVQSVDELGGRGGKVRGLVVLVVLHDREPVGDGGVVSAGRGLARLGGLDGAAGCHDDAETGRAPDSLLRSCDDSIEVPLVEGDLLRAHAAHAVHDHEGVGANAAHQLGHALDVREHAGRCVDVCEGDELVRLLLQGLLHLLERGAIADGSLQVRHVGTVCLKALAEGVAEVAGVEDEGVLAALNQVGGDEIPAQCAASGDDEGLRGGVGGLEELADESQGLAEDLDEAGSDVALTGGVSWLFIVA